MRSQCSVVTASKSWQKQVHGTSESLQSSEARAACCPAHDHLVLPGSALQKPSMHVCRKTCYKFLVGHTPGSPPHNACHWQVHALAEMRQYALMLKDLSEIMSVRKPYADSDSPQRWS